MPELYIGELARRSGRTVHTLRWYEAQGLVPGVRRDTGGRRVYDEQHVAWLELVERLRCTGMSVAGIRRYTELVEQGRKTLGARRELLEAHRRTVEETIREWTAALDLIDRKIEFYGDWIATGKRPPLITHEHKDRPRKL